MTTVKKLKVSKQKVPEGMVFYITVRSNTPHIVRRLPLEEKGAAQQLLDSLWLLHRERYGGQQTLREVWFSLEHRWERKVLTTLCCNCRHNKGLKLYLLDLALLYAMPLHLHFTVTVTLRKIINVRNLSKHLGQRNRFINHNNASSDKEGNRWYLEVDLWGSICHEMLRGNWILQQYIISNC